MRRCKWGWNLQESVWVELVRMCRSVGVATAGCTWVVTPPTPCAQHCCFVTDAAAVMLLLLQIQQVDEQCTAEW